MPRYTLFGIVLESEWHFSSPSSSGSPDIYFLKNNADYFDALRPDHIPENKPFSYHRLPGNGLYLQWKSQFEFHISADHRTIHGRAMPGVEEESLQVYLLGQVISFALLGVGVESLHATTLLIEDVAVAIIGDSGYGKSSLGGAFLRAGHKLISDDLLVLDRRGEEYWAQPGLPRLKLYDVMAIRFISEGRGGVAMNKDNSPKRIYAMEREWHGKPARLAAFYSLVPPHETTGLVDVRLDPLSEREGFIEITKNSFNIAVREIGRLETHLGWAAEVAARVPVRRLGYPRKVEMFEPAVAAVVSDIRTLPSASR